MAREKGEKKLRRKSKWRDGNAKISLEDYLRFLHHRNYSHLCVNFLNQIISMHGYKKIHKSPKTVIAEALNTVALVNPCRSTLRERISPTVAATADDVVADLEELSWQECTVTSVQTISSATHGHSIYTFPELTKRRRSDSTPNGPKALVPIGNGSGVVRKFRQPRKPVKRMKPMR